MISHLADTRGKASHGWLNSRFSFSFADYYDPKRMGFGALRVINDDIIAGGTGFGMHPHRDMEIITIPLSGMVQHKDSEGNDGKIRKGEVQIMSAGTGILHSEYNGLEKEDLKLLQIWVMPKMYNVKPRYEQKAFDLKSNELTLVVSPNGDKGSVSINQDAFFSLGKFETGKSFSYEKKKAGNGLYLFVIDGSVTLEGKTFRARDGVGITDFEKLDLTVNESSELLLMEIPMSVEQ